MRKKTSTVETRAFTVELRDNIDGSKGNTLTGYIAVYNSESQDLGGYKEIIAPGCFDQTLNDDIPCLINHEQVIVGRNMSGTLRLKSDNKGLSFEVDLPNTQPAMDLRELVDRGDLTGCSFGFICLEDSYIDVDGMILRTISKVDLVEVSVGVIWPAYTATSSSVRKLPPSMSREMRSRLSLRDMSEEDDIDPDDEDCACGCPQCDAGACGICSAAPQCAGAMRMISMRHKMQMSLALFAAIIS
jgi:HK97 family phage prohead protease